MDNEAAPTAADDEKVAELLALLDDIEVAAKLAIDGPYYIAGDTALDCPDHKQSGLALIDTGRSNDWPVARLCEWRTAEFVVAVCNAWPRLSRELRTRLLPAGPQEKGDKQ